MPGPRTRSKMLSQSVSRTSHWWRTSLLEAGEKAAILMEHLLQNDWFTNCALINGHPGGGRGGSILPGDICGYTIRFVDICIYAPSRNGWERE